MDITYVLKSPVVTEKSVKAQTGRKYTFLVHQDATKLDVARAVQKAYGVAVDSVNIVSVRKKARVAGRGREITKRHTGRKAIVTLKTKQSLDFNKFKASK
ncbi:50S ribosomal protein L23 [Candidatus Peregrinibacteria bacterium]|nr:50S ribosomal protein L23 [Candidatus Peregrinibacteria bacterium]